MYSPFSLIGLIVEAKSTSRALPLSFEDQAKSIFRQQSLVESESRDASESEQVEEDDCWTLKRASPLTEDDEEEFMSYESPSKKAKNVQTIFWDNQVSMEETFDIASMLGTR